MFVKSYLRETIDGIVYKNIESESEMIDVIKMFLEDFTKDVPFNQFLMSQYNVVAGNLSWEKFVRESIEDGVCLIAVEEKTNNLAGFKINSIEDIKSIHGNPEVKLKETKFDVEPSGDFLNNEKQLDLFQIVNHICTDMGDVNNLLLEKIPSLQKIFSSFAVGISRNFRGRSIAFNLHKYSLKIAKEVETQCATVFAANPITEKILCKLGYLKIKSKVWNTFIFDGKKIFADYQYGADECATFYKDLTS